MSRQLLAKLRELHPVPAVFDPLQRTEEAGTVPGIPPLVEQLAGLARRAGAGLDAAEQIVTLAIPGGQ